MTNLRYQTAAQTGSDDGLIILWIVGRPFLLLNLFDTNFRFALFHIGISENVLECVCIRKPIAILHIGRGNKMI